MYIHTYIHTYFYRFKYILAETNDQLFCFFFFPEKRFVFFLLLYLEKYMKLQKRLKVKNLLHT